MDDTLKILIIDDSEDDVRLLVRWLERSGKVLEWQRVDGRKGLREALQTNRWDLILSDYAIPGLDFFDAVATIKEVDRILPIIAVSGSIGEEQTAKVLRSGVGDLILKDRMERLLPAIERELAAASERRKAADAEEALRNNEAFLRLITDNLPILVAYFDREGRYHSINRTGARWYARRRKKSLATRSSKF